MDNGDITDDVVIRARGLATRHVDDLFLASQYGFRDMFRFRKGSGASKALRARESYSLKSINLDIRKNEFVGVLGGAGSGKTVLANVLGGVISHDEGTLEIKGQTILISRIGRGFRPMLSVAENAFFKAALWGVKRAETDAYIRDALAFANITDLAETPLFNLSPRQERNFSLALAFLLDNDVMIFDNVTVSGDQEVNDRCWARLDALKGKRTIVFLAAKPTIPQRWADRMLLLKDGEIQNEQLPAEALKTYKSLYDATAPEDVEDDSEEKEAGIVTKEDEQELDARARALKKKNPVAEVYKIWIDGEIHDQNAPVWFLVRQGDTIKIKMIVLFLERVSFGKVRLGLHRPFMREPIAESLHGIKDFTNVASDMIDVDRGDSLTMEFTFKVPELPRNPFGITMRLEAQTKAGGATRNSLKVMHFFPVDASVKGNINLLKVTEITGKLQ